MMAPLRPQPVDDGGVGGRRVHGEVDVRRRRGPHVRRVVDVLEGQRDAVHRQPVQIGIGAVPRVQLRRPLERVREPPERLAGRGTVRRQLARRRMRVAAAPAGHRALAAQVERAEGVDLTGIRDAGHHAELRLHGRVGAGGLHPPQVQGNAGVAVDVRQHAGDRHGGRGKADRRAGAHRPAGRGHRRPVARDQPCAGAVVGAGAVDVGLHQPPATDLTVADGLVDALDGRFLEAEPVGLAGGRLRDDERRDHPDRRRECPGHQPPRARASRCQSRQRQPPDPANSMRVELPANPILIAGRGVVSAP